MNRNLNMPTYPFPSLTIPPVREISVGGTSFVPYPAKHLPLYLPGYFSNLVFCRENWVMQRDGNVWMSFSPAELESLSVSLMTAHGDVLIMGLGMGALAWSVKRKPGVRSVTVVDNDPDVIAINRQLGTLDGIDVIEADALTYAPGRRFDAVLVDIWQMFGDMALESDMRAICANIEAGRYVAWTQELAFVRWAADNMSASQITDPSAFGNFCDAVGIALYDPTPEITKANPDQLTYVSWCLQAMLVALNARIERAMAEEQRQGASI